MRILVAKEGGHVDQKKSGVPKEQMASVAGLVGKTGWGKGSLWTGKVYSKGWV